MEQKRLQKKNNIYIYIYIYNTSKRKGETVVAGKELLADAALDPQIDTQRAIQSWLMATGGNEIRKQPDHYTYMYSYYLNYNC